MHNLASQCRDGQLHNNLVNSFNDNGGIGLTKLKDLPAVIDLGISATAETPNLCGMSIAHIHP